MIKNRTLGISSNAPYCHHHEAVWAGDTILLAKLIVRAAKTNKHRPLQTAKRMARAGGALEGGSVAAEDVAPDAEARL